MLPAAARLTSGQDFGLVVRRGRRAARPRLVLHALISGTAEQTWENSETSPKVGFVVSKAVGNSVIRHRVTRRLRHLIRDRLVFLPANALLVIRALPPASTATSAELGRDLDSTLDRLGLSPKATKRLPDTQS